MNSLMMGSISSMAFITSLMPAGGGVLKVGDLTNFQAKWDGTRLPHTDITLSESGQMIHHANSTATNAYPDIFTPSVDTIPLIHDAVYWEIEKPIDGFSRSVFGLLHEDKLADYATKNSLHLQNDLIVSDYIASASGNGWGVNRPTASRWPDAATGRYMFYFRPYTGEMIVGYNGSWEHDPAGPGVSARGKPGKYYLLAAPSWANTKPISFRLHTDSASLMHPVPAGAVALKGGTVATYLDRPIVRGVRANAITGFPKAKTIAHYQRINAVTGFPKTKAVVLSQTVNAILRP